MPSSTSPPVSREADDPRLTLALWTGVLAGPLMFLSLLEVNYVFSYVACEAQTTWFLHAATVVAVALSLSAGLWGWRAGHDSHSGRVRWMAIGALLSMTFFVVATVALDIPAMVLRPCQ